MALMEFEKDNFQFDRDGEDDFLGAGSFGEVYKATIKGSYQVVALKIFNIPRRLAKSDKELVQKEAQIMSSLLGQHPNIIGLLGVCLQPGCYALVLEYMKNGSVDRVMTEGKTPTHLTAWDPRIRMGLDVASGMAFLHSHDPPIAHRDLKSANVLLDDDYRCKISDFGLAKTQTISNSTSSRYRPNPAGTLAFIAPEKFEQGETSANSFTGDIYSFAVLAWQIKEMKQPFREGSYELIRSNVLAGQRPTMTSNDGCPDVIRTLIENCWHGVPANRPRFAEIVTKIKFVLEGTPGNSISPPRLLHPEVVHDARMVSPPHAQAALQPVVEQVTLADTRASPQPIPGRQQAFVGTSQATSPLRSPASAHASYPEFAIPRSSPLQSPREMEIGSQLQTEVPHQRGITVDTNHAPHETATPRVQTERAAHSTTFGGHGSGYNIPNAVLRVIQNHGSTRFIALAKEMGFSDNKISGCTAQCVSYPDKLHAIFSLKANASGSYEAMKAMIRACNTIQEPIFGIVAEDLRKDTQIPPEILADLLRV